MVYDGKFGARKTSNQCEKDRWLEMLNNFMSGKSISTKLGKLRRLEVRGRKRKCGLF